MTEKPMLFRLSLAIALCLMGSVSLYAQVQLGTDPQLFAGAWRFEPKSSTSPPALIDARTGEVLKITVKMPLFRIVQISTLSSDGVKIGGHVMTKGDKRSAVIDLYADRRGETNATQPFNPEHFEASQSYLENGVLFRRWAIKPATPAANAEFKEVLTYKVSRDGKTLFVETVPEAGGVPLRFVYKKCKEEDC